METSLTSLDRHHRGTGEALPRLLATAPVFAGLAATDRAIAASLAVGRRYEKGEVIARHGEAWTRVLLVAEGTVRLVKGSATGRLLAAVTLGPGEAFFAHSLFDDAPLPATLEGESPCLLYLWDGPTLLRLVRGSPAALWQLAQTLVRQMRKAADVIDSLAFLPLPRRLARLVVEQFGHAGQDPAPRTLTLDEMAARIGTTREVVCRLLYRFADEGLISITRTECSLLDRRRLEELAEGGSVEPPDDPP